MLDSPAIKSIELYAVLNQASKDITAIREWLFKSQDRIDVHIIENLNEFSAKVEEAKRNHNTLSDQRLAELRKLYEKVVYPFDFAGKTKPTTAVEGQTWFNPTTGLIYIYKKNPKVRFFSATAPAYNTRRINDIWYKPNASNFRVGEIYLCESVVENKAWISPTLPANLRPSFEGTAQPSNPQLGDIWKKGNEYFVYVKTTSGNSWISPESPQNFTPTYTSTTAPANPNLGEIWKKGSEYFIYARLSANNAWIKKTSLGINGYDFFSQDNEKLVEVTKIISNLNNKNATEVTKENELKDIQAQITAKQNQIKQIDAQIAEYKKQVPPKNTTTLEAQKTTLQNQLNALNTNKTNKQNEINALANQRALINRATLDAELAKKVGMSGNETIAGNKTFSNAVAINGTATIKGATSIAGATTISGVATFQRNATFAVVPTCNASIAPSSSNSSLINKTYADYGGGLLNLGTLGGAVNIDLRNAQHFYITLNASSTLKPSNWGGAGKSGTITINGANNISSFSAPFKFRIAQSGFSGLEVFAYFCINKSNVRLVRL